MDGDEKSTRQSRRTGLAVLLPLQQGVSRKATRGPRSLKVGVVVRRLSRQSHAQLSREQGRSQSQEKIYGRDP